MGELGETNLDKYLEIEEVTNLSIVQDEKTFDDHHSGAVKVRRLGRSLMSCKAVVGDLY